MSLGRVTVVFVSCQLAWCFEALQAGLVRLLIDLRAAIRLDIEVVLVYMPLKSGMLAKHLVALSEIRTAVFVLSLVYSIMMAKASL